MRFPFVVRQTLFFNQQEYGISSNGYLIHQLEDYMEQFGMQQERVAENELFFHKGDLLHAFRPKDFLQNVLFRVQFDEKNIRITLEMETLRILTVGFLAGVVVFVIPEKLLLVPVVLVPALCWSYGFLMKWTAIRFLKRGVAGVMNELKEV